MYEVLVSPTLGSRIEILSGFAFPSSGFNQLEGLPLIRIRDLGNSTTEVRFRGNYDKTYLVRRGDLLIGMDGDFEVYRWSGDYALLNQRVCKITSISKNINQSFLYWYLKPTIADIHKKTPQTTVRHLSTKDINSIAAPVIGAAEQRLVAQILDTLNITIRKTEAIIEKLKQIKQGLLHDLLTRGIAANGELRPPYEQAPHLYKESPLGWIPKKWNMGVLSDVAAVSRGKFTHRPRNDPAYYGGIYPFIQTGDVAAALGGIITNYSQTLSELGVKVSQEFPVGTIAITIAANIADTAILGIPMYFPDSVVGAVVKPDANRRFVELCIRAAKPRLESRAPQSAQKNINLQDLRPLPIPLPTITEQDRIAERYETIRARIEKEEMSLAKYKNQKSALMDDILTGRVRVTPLLKGHETPQNPSFPSED